MKKQTTYLVLTAFLFSGCAQFVPPTGGKKDDKAPELVESIPKNKSKNYLGNQLTLIFNEGIDATGLRQDLIVSPELDGGYEVKTNLMGVTLKFNQTLKENTTYTFNFRNGIKDLNERNPAKNLKIVFSTGNNLDSLSIRGKVNQLFTQKPAAEALVGLYTLQPTDTLPFYARKPDYFIKTDTSGQFLFENLKDAPYRLMAFQDKNNNLLPDATQEWLGFRPDTLKAAKEQPPFDLFIYPADKKEPKIRRKLARIQNHSITYDKSIETYEIDWVDSTQKTWVLKKPNELLFIPKGTPPSDTLLVDITAIDSVGNTSKLREKIYFAPGNPTKRTLQPLAFASQPVNNSQFTRFSQVDLVFPVPITQVLPERIQLSQDSTRKQPWIGQWLDENQTTYRISFDPIQKPGKWNLQITSAAFTSYQGDTTANRNLTFEVVGPEETGVLKIQLADSCDHCLLEWKRVGETRPQLRPILFQTRLENLLPGDYQIRVIFDKNKNGVWDNGDFTKNIPAENIFVHPSILRMKPNFEIEQTLQTPVDKKEDKAEKAVEKEGDK